MQSISSRLQRRITRLGFEGAPTGNLFHAVIDTVAHATGQAALSAGIRHVDTAPHYEFGLSESRLGASLAHVDPGGDVVALLEQGALDAPVPEAT